MAETRRSRRPRFDIVITVVVLTLGVLTVLQGYVLGNRTEQLSRCQLAYTTGFADAIDARTKANQEVTDAQDELWRTVQRGFQAPGPDARAQFERQLNAYLTAREEAKKAQQSNPYPPAPRDLCPESAR